MFYGKNILSVLLAALVLTGQFHIFELGSWAQDDKYSFCAVDSDHKEHGAAHLDCEICIKKIHSNFIVNSTQLLYGNKNECLLSYHSIIIFNHFAEAYASRAPPSILS